MIAVEDYRQIRPMLETIEGDLAPLVDALRSRAETDDLDIEHCSRLKEIVRRTESDREYFSLSGLTGPEFGVPAIPQIMRAQLNARELPSEYQSLLHDVGVLLTRRVQVFDEMRRLWVILTDEQQRSMWADRPSALTKSPYSDR